jgi:hypothetical protein
MAGCAPQSQKSFDKPLYKKSLSCMANQSVFFIVIIVERLRDARRRATMAVYFVETKNGTP